MSRTGMANLITRLRDLTNTRWVRMTDTATGDGTTSVYWLTHKPNESGGTVSVGGVVSGTADYTWDTNDGRVAFDTAPASGTAVLVEYRASDFTDDHLEDTLESYCTLVENTPLTWLYEQNEGGTPVYLRSMTPGIRDLEEVTSGTSYWRVTDSTGAIVGTTTYTADYRMGLFTFTADQGGSVYYLTARSYDIWAAAADIWTEKAALYSDQFSFNSDGQAFQRKELIENAKAMAEQCRRKAGSNKQRGDMYASTFVRSDINRSTW